MSLLLHISDLHLFEDSRGELKGICTDDSYTAVLKAAYECFPSPDLVLFGGDVAQDETASAYLRAAKKLPWQAPVMITPGNHASLPELTGTLIPALNEKSSYSDHWQHAQWQVITLNSHQPGAVSGCLAREELVRLRTLLQSSGGRHTLVALHHQPIDVGSRWLDRIGLDNRDELWEIIAEFPQVRTLLCGHIHQDFDAVYEGVRVLGSPSTCIQFKPSNEDFGMDDISPGYRWIRLLEGGEIETGVERITGFIPPDMNNNDPY